MSVNASLARMPDSSSWTNRTARRAVFESIALVDVFEDKDGANTTGDSPISPDASSFRSLLQPSPSIRREDPLNDSAGSNSSSVGNLRRHSSNAQRAKRTSAELEFLNELKFDTCVSLIGRTEELETLQKARTRLERASRSGSDGNAIPMGQVTREGDEATPEPAAGIEMVMLSGGSGCGKSAIARRFCDHSARRGQSVLGRRAGGSAGVIVGVGKFDMSRAGESFSAFSSAFTEVCNHILALRANNSAVFAKIRREVRSSVGMDDDTLNSIIPNLRLVIEDVDDASTSAVSANANSEERRDSATKLADIWVPSNGVFCPRSSRRSSALSLDAFAKNRGLLVQLADGPRAQNKFHFLVRRFVRAVTTCCQLILFIDDLQWADKSSLDLLQALSLDRQTRGLLLVGCYRREDITRELEDKLEHINSHGEGIVNLTEITVNNLDLDVVNLWLESLFSMEPGQARALAEVVHARTGGNPLFVREFLTSLRDRRLISYCTNKLRWIWEEDHIRKQTNAMDHVADVLHDKMERILSQGDLEILGIASCLGSSFDIDVLTTVVQDVHLEVWDSENGLLDLVGEQFVPDSMREGDNKILRCLELCVEEGILEIESRTDGGVPYIYRFVHDQIQAAAFANLSCYDTRAIQSKIGHALMEHLDSSKSDFEKLLFIAVDLMNRGGSLNESEKKKNSLAKLNLIAAWHANSNSAFCSAARFLRAGIDLLKSCEHFDYWSEQKDVALALFSSACEVEYTVGNFEACKLCVDEILSREDLSLDEKLRAHSVLILALTAQNKMMEAVKLSLKVLAQLKVCFPTSTAAIKTAILPRLIQTKRFLKGRSTEALLGLPVMEDQRRRACMLIMDMLITCSYAAKPDLLPIVNLKMVRWSIKYGLCSQSPTAFMTYGTILSCVFGDLKGGYKFGEMALSMLKKLDDLDVEARSNFVVHYGLTHWVKPLQAVLVPLLKGYESGLQSGDVESAIFCIHWHCLALLNTGKPLSIVESDMQTYAHQMKDHHQTYTYKAQCISWQYSLNLMGKSADPLVLSGTAWTKDDAVDGDLHISMLEKTRRCWLAYHFGEFRLAWDIAKDTPDLKKFSLGSSIIWRHCFYVGLVASALAKKTGSFVWRRRVAGNRKRLRDWQRAGNLNCHHMVTLLDAEIAALRGADRDSVKKKYDEAITVAGRSGLRQDCAIANELAGEYFLWIDDYWARYYIRRAVEKYTEWEAFAKVRQLKEAHRGLIV